jgi:hypothetical protein
LISATALPEMRATSMPLLHRDIDFMRICGQTMA